MTIDTEASLPLSPEAVGPRNPPPEGDGKGAGKSGPQNRAPAAPIIVSVQRPDGSWQPIRGITGGQIDPMDDGSAVVITPSSFEIAAQIRFSFEQWAKAMRAINRLVVIQQEIRRLCRSRMHADYRRKKRGHR